MSRHGTHHLARWQRLALHGTGTVLLASGLAWLALHHTIGGGVDLPHPAEPWLMRLHGLAGFAALFLLGMLAAAHVPAGWRMSARPQRAPQRATGVALCTLAALLTATGYALYYFAPESVRPALGWGHAGLGVAMAVVVAWHRQLRMARRGVAA